MKYLAILFILLSAQTSYGQAIGNVVPAAPVVTKSQNVVSIPCGANINSYTASAAQGGTHGYGPGTVFQLAGTAASPCTYSGQTFHTQNNESIEGDASSPTGANTILDGGNGATNGPFTALTSGAPARGGDGTTGVTIEYLTIQNYAGSKTCSTTYNVGVGCTFHDNVGRYENSNAQIYTWNGWLLSNDTFTGSGGWGLQLDGSATVQNSRIVGNHQGGVNPQTCLPGTNSSQPVKIVGNEIGNNNARGDDSSFSAGGMKAVGCDGIEMDVLNNWVHDNNAAAGTVGLWTDIQACSPCKIQGNTIVNNGRGYMCEITGHNATNDVSHNVAINTASNAFSIYLNECTNFNVHDNYVNTDQNNTIVNEASCRADANGNSNTNLAFYNNTEVFTYGGGNKGAGIMENGTAPGTSCGNISTWSEHNNTYYVASSSDHRWAFGTMFYSFNTLANVQNNWGQESGSVVTAGGGPTGVNGCQQVGCTGSGW
jgi:hypothetical protein